MVGFSEDCSFHLPGANSSHYEDARESYDAHLVFNSFLLIPNFCVHQMLMRHGRHAIDLSIITTLITVESSGPYSEHFWKLWRAIYTLTKTYDRSIPQKTPAKKTDAVCRLKSLERGNTSHNLYPEYRTESFHEVFSAQSWSTEWAQETSM